MAVKLRILLFGRVEFWDSEGSAKIGSINNPKIASNKSFFGRLGKPFSGRKNRNSQIGEFGLEVISRIGKYLLSRDLYPILKRGDFYGNFEISTES